MKALDIIGAALLVIGGLNWGLIGFFDYNFITAIFGEGSAYGRVFYALVGLSALMKLATSPSGTRRCGSGGVKLPLLNINDITGEGQTETSGKGC